MMKSFAYSGKNYPVLSYKAVVVGTGAASYAAADNLFDLGVTDIAIVTEGIRMGTSRNTGSDKQTYYKLTLSGDAPDSVAEMAQSLFEGGGRDGDTALCEAALSARCFYRLCDLGVPFPHNRFGEYVGYKTDHDPRSRASSCGPLTSKYMTEALEASCARKKIPVLDGMLAVAVIRDHSRALGLICLDTEKNLPVILLAGSIIFATGGPAGMYSASVYPESQTGATGVALRAGICGANLCESQYGIASTSFRWNLSGTYQQVLPRYISRNADGSDEREFLQDWFPNAQSLSGAVFLKGYQWPFDVRKIENYGSSLIDILVYNETVLRGREVFLDFRENPECLSDGDGLIPDLLSPECREYLTRSGALEGRPIDRLRRMNPAAIELYMDHGIDLSREPLKIAVCAQHNNGGLYADANWQSDLSGFYPVGEVCGNFGLYRPGGSALNATQVGALRAAQHIAYNGAEAPAQEKIAQQISSALGEICAFIEAQRNSGKVTCASARETAASAMTRAGAHIRAKDEALAAKQLAEEMLSELSTGSLLSDGAGRLADAFRLRDILTCQVVYLSAVIDHISAGFGSRGSYLVEDPAGHLAHENLPEVFRYRLDGGGRDVVRLYRLNPDTMETECFSRPVRPVPQEDNWFENVWNSYRRGEVFR